MSAEQLALDIGLGATATWAELRVGDRIRWEGRTWRVDTEPQPSIWSQVGHAAHCPACMRHRGMPPAPDCDGRDNGPHVSLSLSDCSVDHTHGAGHHAPAGEVVPLVARRTAPHKVITAEMRGIAEAREARRRA